MDDDTQARLQELCEEIDSAQKTLVKENLKDIDYLLDHRGWLTLVVKEPQPRIEQVRRASMLEYLLTLLQWLLPVLSEILPSQLETITQEVGRIESKVGLQLTEYNWEDLDRTLTELVWTFHDRAEYLLDCWKLQGLDVVRQIRSFSGGIFGGWYKLVSI